MNVPERIRVAVLRGGNSHDYDTSLETGARVIRALRDKPEHYEPLDIFISKDGQWHKNGRIVEPHIALQHAGVAFNALTGAYGEDGGVQKTLRQLHIPFTGTQSVGSALAHNRDHAREAYKRYDLESLRHKTLLRDSFEDDNVHDIFRNFMHPVRVRPLGVKAALAQVVHAFHDLDAAIKEALTVSHKAYVEEWPRGKEVHSGVVEGLRGEDLYALIPVPHDFTVDMHKEIEAAARAAHQALGLRHFSSSHFVVTPSSKLYIVETSTVPELTETGSLGRSLSAVGIPEDELIEHLISLARYGSGKYNNQ